MPAIDSSLEASPGIVHHWVPARGDGLHAAPEPGTFFSRRIRLEGRRHACLVQLQLDLAEAVGLGEIAIEAWLMTESGDVLLDRQRIPLAGATRETLEDVVLRIQPAHAGVVLLCGRATGMVAPPQVRQLQLLTVGASTPIGRHLFHERGSAFSARYLKTLFLGTTNACNANCPHCPTNKKMTSHLPRGVMSDAVFERLVEGLADVDVAEACFGLFGEPFNDPALETRVRRLADAKPGIQIDIATNAGVASLDRIATVLADVRRVAIHVEAVTPERYNKLMVPVKADEVLPRIDDIVGMAPNKVLITTPLHQGNLLEARGIVQRWQSRGAEVRFSPLQTRVTDRTAARRMALAPAPGFWGSDLLDILVVDWDGIVLSTCDDFLRRHPIGNLAEQALAEILDGAARRTAFDDLRNYRWHRLPSLYDAVVDAEGEVHRHASNAIGNAPISMRLGAQSFQVNPPGVAVGNRIALGSTACTGNGDTPQVFGPYAGLHDGHYVARWLFEVEGDLQAAEAFPEIVCEVASGFGRHRHGLKRGVVTHDGHWTLQLEFEHATSLGPLELRVYAEFDDAALRIHFVGAEIDRVV